MARNEQDERNRQQSNSPNSRDFDREYNPQGSRGNRPQGGRERGDFQNYYSGNAGRWTGYDEGEQHWREDQSHGGAEFERRREYQARERDYRGEESRDEARRRGYGRDEWGREGASTYGSGVSSFSTVGPFSSPGLTGGYADMGSYTGYAGGMGTYAGRRRGPYAGRGPKNYQRSDERIREEVNERLTDHPDIDPTDVEVHVEAGLVTLTGIVEDRHAKRLAEDIADGVAGVHDVNNQIRVRRRGESQPEPETDQQQVTTLGINPGDRKLKQTETK